MIAVMQLSDGSCSLLALFPCAGQRSSRAQTQQPAPSKWHGKPLTCACPREEGGRCHKRNLFVYKRTHARTHPRTPRLHPRTPHRWHYLSRKRATQPPPKDAVVITAPPGPLGVRFTIGAGRKGTRIAKFNRKNGAKGFLEQSGVQRGWYLTHIDDVDTSRLDFRAVMSMVKLSAKRQRVLCFRPPTKQQTLQLALDGLC